MERIYFISCSYLKSHTTLNDNIDDNLLNSAIWEAQTIHIQQVMGTKLFKKISNLIKSGDINNSQYADYKTLLDNYVVDCTAYWAWVECIPYLAMKTVNKGIERQNSEWSNAAAINEIEYLRDDIRNKAEFYTRRLSDFILENRIRYPEYIQNNRIDEMHPDGGEYFSGIQFDGYICPCDRTMGNNRNAIDIL